ncbi:hypothetical protein TeGR_g264, partial [Tetraparma gracilis]
MVDDNILSILLDACKPLFDLVSSSDSNPSAMKPADLLMSTAKLIIAAGFKMQEQARQEMAEEDLGGGIFDHDVEDMRDFASKVASVSEPQVYDADERQQLDITLARFNAEISLKKYKTGTKLFSAEITDKGEVSVRLKLNVRAPPEQIVSYYMGNANQFAKHNNSYGSGFSLGERRSNHSLIAGGTIPFPQPFQDRAIVIKILWEKLDDDNFFVSQVASTHDSVPVPVNAMPASITRFIKLTRIGPSLTKYELVGSMNLNGSIPAHINKIVTVPYITRLPVNLVAFFTSVRHADAFNEGDGTVLGRLLFLQLHPHRQNRDLLNEKTLDVIRMTNVLRSAQAKYRFFDEFLFHIIRNAMKRGAVQTKFTVKTHLVALTANEAGRIARSLVSIIMANATAVAAVDEHIMTYPALGELDREFRWFRPMMEAIATELMDRVAIGIVPDLGRGTAFVVIFAMCAFQIFAKAGATALIAVTKPAWLWYYFLGDHGLHFAYRIARRDLVFFGPMPAAVSYVCAFPFRIMGKICTDFTGTPLFRLPLLGGGSYYAFCLASSQASVFAAVHVYVAHAPPPEGAGKLEPSTLWTGAAALAGAWLCTFLFFAFRIAVP